jgi:hypothetical protein
MLFGLGPKRLPTFRSVNACQPDFMLNLVGIEDYDGVTVSDPHNAPCERLGVYRQEGEKQNK